MINKIKFNCEFCLSEFFRWPSELKKAQKKNRKGPKFCSKKCLSFFNKTLYPEVCCLNCNKIFHKYQKELNKTPNSFCSRSCAATYNNTHKTKGTRRSKLEKWLEMKLNELYPNLEIHYSRKDAINSELDIYIPSLKLAFELNGIFHYEPIYGCEKLQQIQNNDNRKFQACLEQGIELCIIDSSKQKYFKESTCLPFLDIITEIIECKWLAIRATIPAPSPYKRDALTK